MAEWREEAEDMECSNQVCNVEGGIFFSYGRWRTFSYDNTLLLNWGDIPGLALLLWKVMHFDELPLCFASKKSKRSKHAKQETQKAKSKKQKAKSKKSFFLLLSLFFSCVSTHHTVPLVCFSLYDMNGLIMAVRRIRHCLGKWSLKWAFHFYSLNWKEW